MQEEFTVQFNDSALSWLLTCGNTAYHIHLSRGTLVNDFFGWARHYSPEDAANPRSSLAPFNDPLYASRCESDIRLAPDDRQCLWGLSDWTQPDADGFNPNLKGTPLPLHLQLSFTLQKDTGILRRGAVLTHIGAAGSNEPIDICGAGSLSTLVPPDIQQAVYLSGKWGAETQVSKI